MRACRIGVAVAACLSVGCASMMMDPEEPILITSHPPGAHVQIDGSYVGRTPVSITRKAKDFGLVLEREGCSSHSTQVKATTDAGAVAASVASGVLLIGAFEAISLADGGSSLYSNLPDVINVALMCDESVEETTLRYPRTPTR